MDKSANIKERVIQVAKTLGISLEKFFPHIGTTYGNFKGKSKNTPLSSDTIYNLLLKFPIVDAHWLLTGNGEMFNNDTIKYSEYKNILRLNDLSVEALDKTVKLKDEHIKLLDRVIEKLEKELEFLKTENSILKAEIDKLKNP